ncbi:MAG: type IV pilus secretin PilQ [Methylococcaceae bacterium]
MIKKQGGNMLNRLGRFCLQGMLGALLAATGGLHIVNAQELKLQHLDVASKAGDKLLIQLEMDALAVEPKVFQTNNPARIALDFTGVKNGLDKKLFPINQGVANSINVAEGGDRLRVVVNLSESVPFETKVEGNKVLLTLTNAKSVIPERDDASFKKSVKPAISSLIPQQNVSGFDFKRGGQGEGRILVSLANPNTIVNSKEEGGKVIISLLNTTLPADLARKLDVTDFATPVKYIDVFSSNRETTLTVGMQNSLYDYSLFQTEGLLTIEFRPLTSAEKDTLKSQREKYTGERLSLNFQDIDIRSVISILAEFTGQNVVAGDDVTGTVTLKLDDVPWDEALDFVMLTKGLEKYETGNVTLIAPVGKVKEYKEKQRETENVVEKLEPLVTEYIKVNYARAENFRNLLNGVDTGAFGSCGVAKSASASSGSAPSFGSSSSSAGAGSGSSGSNANEERRILSARGSAVVDSRTNTLILRETAKRIEEAKALIHRLDVPVRQVMIESRIVLANNNFLKDLGVRFGAAKRQNAGGGNGFGFGGAGTRGDLGTTTTTTTLNSDGTSTTSGTSTPATITSQDLLTDLGAAVGAGSGGALGLTLVNGADYVLNLELSALQNQNLAEIISNPRIMTADRCQANIKQGTQLPFQTVSNAGTQTQFIDATLTLDVTPQITPSGSIIMDLLITQDSPGATTPSGVGINTRQVKTNIRVNDGETVVLGGIYESTNNDSVNKVPFFGDLPGIGFLFKRTTKQDDRSELLVFITPKIIRDALANR